MKIAIMQPYFLPYIGYFQLISSCDVFVIYDNIEYTKKGWINRNRIVLNGKEELISLPLKKDSDYLHVNQRFLAQTFEEDAKKWIRRVGESYKKAPHFNAVFPIFKEIMEFKNFNLFYFIENSLQHVLKYLEIDKKIMHSSTIAINASAKGENKVLEICKALKAKEYINAIGGKNLYSQANFKAAGIGLHFIQSHAFEYAHVVHPFIPWLSILDVMMYNSKEKLQATIATGYDLIQQ